MYRHRYLCRNHGCDRSGHSGAGIAETHYWEAFGDQNAPCNCPLCGNACTPLASEWAERNEQYFALTGYGFCMVMQAGHADPLKTLDEFQLEALVEFLLLGSFGKVSPDEHLLGHWGLGDHEKFSCDEEEYRMTAAAALVYLSGRLAEDIPLLQREKEELPRSDGERVYTPKKMPVAAAMQQARDQIRAALDNLTETQADAFVLLNIARMVLGRGHTATMDLDENIPPDQE